MKFDITEAQLRAIVEMAEDGGAMVGGGDYEVDKAWAGRIKLINRMLVKNGRKPVNEPTEA